MIGLLCRNYVYMLIKMLLYNFKMTGVAGTWCWIGPEHFIARVMLLYLWLVVDLILISYLYCHVAFAVRGKSKKQYLIHRFMSMTDRLTITST